MAFLDWKPQLSVQVLSLDHEHQHLMKLINELHDGMLQGRTQEATRKTISQLSRYTQLHFRHEESLMERAGYPGLPRHREEHRRLTARVAEFEREFAAGRIALSVPLMQFLKTWLTEHIQRSDLSYSGHMKTHGIH